MANILNLITIGEKQYYVVDADPATGGGTSAEIGSLAVYDSGTVGSAYIKTGSLDTAWDKINTSAATGTIDFCVAVCLTLYPSTGNIVDDVFVQNSQNIDINIVAQPTRSAGIEYSIPNPGDAVTAADFVLTEGAQTINGNKTFGNDVIVSGNLTVNGSLTSLNTTNTTITDKLLTLNKGGAASSAGGSGFEFEENSLITAYLKINAAETGFSFKSPTIASFADILTSSLTSNRSLSLPDTSGTFVARPNGTPGVAGQAAFFSDANNIISDSGFAWDNTGKRLTITNLTSTNAPTISAFGLGIVHSSAAGVLSSSALSLTTDVSGVLPLANGGSNANLTAVAGTIVYSTAAEMAFSAAGTTGQALLSGGTGAPTWFTGTGVVHSSSGVLSASAVSLTADVSGVLPVANGGTNSSTALVGKQIMVSNSGGTAIVEAGAMTNGQFLIGSTGASPVIASISGTSNQITMTPGAGSITLSTPQNIDTAAAVTFLSQTLSGSGAFFELVDAADMKMSTATVNTTDATVTTIATVASASNTTMLVEARITGVRTGGSAGTAGDSCSYVRTVRAKNVAGTLTLLNLQSDYTSEDQTAFDSTITVSGTNVLVRVKGAANNNMTWKALITKIL